MSAFISSAKATADSSLSFSSTPAAVSFKSERGGTAGVVVNNAVTAPSPAAAMQAEDSFSSSGPMLLRDRREHLRERGVGGDNKAS